MTSGNEEGLEALSLQGKLFPCKAREPANSLSPAAADVSRGWKGTDGNTVKSGWRRGAPPVG